jgi:hypothetical protein
MKSEKNSRKTPKAGSLRCKDTTLRSGSPGDCEKKPKTKRGNKEKRLEVA